MRDRPREKPNRSSSEVAGVVAPVHPVSRPAEVGALFATADGGFRIRYHHWNRQARPLNRVDDCVVMWVTPDGEIWQAHAADQVIGLLQDTQS